MASDERVLAFLSFPFLLFHNGTTHLRRNMYAQTVSSVNVKVLQCWPSARTRRKERATALASHRRTFLPLVGRRRPIARSRGGHFKMRSPSLVRSARARNIAAPCALTGEICGCLEQTAVIFFLVRGVICSLASHNFTDNSRSEKKFRYNSQKRACHPHRCKTLSKDFCRQAL